VGKVVGNDNVQVISVSLGQIANIIVLKLSGEDGLDANELVKGVGNDSSGSVEIRGFTESSLSSSFRVVFVTSENVGVNSITASISNSTLGMSRAPSKFKIFLTLDGSFNSRLARRSPALITDPGERLCVIFPLSVALMGMIIFMASTSTNGSPASTLAPLS
jgi:hypothetical protein